MFRRQFTLTLGYDSEKYTFSNEDNSPDITFTGNLVGIDVVSKLGDTKLSMENMVQYSLLGSSYSASTSNLIGNNPRIFKYGFKLFYHITDYFNVNFGVANTNKIIEVENNRSVVYGDTTVTFGAAYTF